MEPLKTHIEGVVTHILFKEHEKYPETTLVVMETQGRYPASLACTFGKNRSLVDGITKGSKVSITGYVGSRSKQGDESKWFTSFSATDIKVISAGSSTTTHSERQPGADDGDDDKLGF